jgi:NAD+ synthase
MDYKQIATKLQDGIKEFLGDKNAIIGISGGIDSAVVATLCVNAVGKDRVIGVQMPYGEQSVRDGTFLVRHLGINDCIFDIKPMVNSFSDVKMFSDKIINGNIRARVRMTLIYAFANSHNGFVMGTSNKTEFLLGYFTKFGDGGCDLEPIGDLYKTEIFELAKYLGVPECIINKKPSAELWDGQTDEGEIGMTYAEMDEILKGMDTNLVLCNRPILQEEKYGKDKVEAIVKRITSTEHKRHMPKTLLIN